jgi:hypothetical protein
LSQIVHDWPEPICQFTGQELACGQKLGFAVRRYRGGDAFGGCEIDSAIKVSAGSEFAGLGLASAEANELFDQDSGEQWITGDVKLDQILTGEAARRVKAIYPRIYGELCESKHLPCDLSPLIRSMGADAVQK